MNVIDLILFLVALIALLLAFWVVDRVLKHQPILPLRAAPLISPPIPPWPQVSAVRARELRKMPYDTYLNTPEWRERSRLMKERAGWTCQQCGSDQFLETHHLTYRRLGNERPADLRVLCRECHLRTHA